MANGAEINDGCNEGKSYVRSDDRCHLISTIPIVDSNGRVPMYLMTFTVGNVFARDSLKVRHIHHVLTGYMIRRSVSSFIGKRASAVMRLPLDPKLLEYVDAVPLGRLVILLQQTEEATVSSQHLLRTLQHLNLRFGIDLDQLITTPWRYCINSFSYVFLRADDEHLTENIMLFGQLKEQAPWLRLIVYGFQNRADLIRLRVSEADYVMTNLSFPGLREVIKEVAAANPKLLLMARAISRPVPDVEVVSYLAGNFAGLIRDFYTGLRYIGARRGERRQASSVINGIEIFGRELVAATMAVGIVNLIFKDCRPKTANAVGNPAFVPLRNSLSRGFFLYYIAKHAGYPFKDQMALFICGLFSIWNMLAEDAELPICDMDWLRETDNRLDTLSAALIRGAAGFECNCLAIIAEASFDSKQSVGAMLKAYEKALMRTEDVLALTLETQESISASIVSKS